MSGDGRRWAPILAREIRVGDVVSVLGMDSRNSVIVHVSAVKIDRKLGQAIIAGRQPWGSRWRVVERTLLVNARAERLVDVNGDPA